MGAIAAVAVGATVAAAAVGGAVIQADAQRKAANKMKDALSNMQTPDPEALSKVWKDTDLQKYQDQFTNLRKVDPETAALQDNSLKTLGTMTGETAGDRGLGTLHDSLIGAKSDVTANQNLINQRVGVQDANAAKIQGLGDRYLAAAPDAATLAANKDYQAQVKDRASQLLAEGGQLSPQQQAELVRAGLENAGARGMNAGSGATRQTVGRLLASESENLANSRAANSTNLFGFAQNSAGADQSAQNTATAGAQGAFGQAGGLFANNTATVANNNTQAINNRATLDTNAAQSLVQKDAQQVSRNANLLGIAQSRTPNIGPSGNDVVSLYLAKMNAKNGQAIGIANTEGQKAMAQAGMYSGALNGIASGVSSGAGMYMGLQNMNSMQTMAGTNAPASSSANPQYAPNSLKYNSATGQFA